MFSCQNLWINKKTFLNLFILINIFSTQPTKAAQKIRLCGNILTKEMLRICTPTGYTKSCLHSEGIALRNKRNINNLFNKKSKEIFDDEHFDNGKLY